MSACRRLRAGARECATDARPVQGTAAALEAQGTGRRGARDAAARRRRPGSRGQPSSRASWRARSSRAAISRPPPSTSPSKRPATIRQLLLTVADIQLRGDKAEDGLAIVRRLLEEHPDRREEDGAPRLDRRRAGARSGLHRRGTRGGRRGRARQDWASAAAALQEFVTRVPNHIPALMRLVEICVDGGLEATMYSAQAQLADAYIAGGLGRRGPLHRRGSGGARAVGPDRTSSVSGARWSCSASPIPEALIAERLSGQSPFMTTDLFLDSHEFPSSSPDDAPSRRCRRRRSSADGRAAALLAAIEGEPEAEGRTRKPAAEAGAARSPRTRSHFELSANAIDLESILGELESPPGRRARVDRRASKST